MKLNASEVFVKSLEMHGVEYIFGVPGEENLAFLEALRLSKIKFIITRNEQAGVFMASTFGRLTGKVGVALSTLGPGATNLMTGIAYAQLGAMPLLVITGQKPVRHSKQGKFQIIDAVRMIEGIAKFSYSIPSADRTASLVHEAIKIAEAERPGAVHLELPEDIAVEETDIMPIDRPSVRRSIADPKAIRIAIEAIQSSQRPLIIVGSGANRKLIRKQLTNLLEKTHIPFVNTQMGKGVISEESEYYIGTTALSSKDYVHKMINNADCIIVIGHDTKEKPPAFFDTDRQKVIHIHFYPSDIDLVYTPHHEVVGDISNTLWTITENIEVNDKWDFTKMHEIRDSLREDIKKMEEDNRFPLLPQRVVEDIQNVLDGDGILSLDNGMYKIWIARNYKTREQNSVLLDNALATMGAGLSAGIASKMLYPEKKVLVVAGDGGIMMNIGELETARRLSLDLVVLILNDNAFGMIKWKQKDMELVDYGLSFTNPDFIKLAESFGCSGYRVERAEDLQILLSETLNKKGIHIIECPVDYSLNNEMLGKVFAS